MRGEQRLPRWPGTYCQDKNGIDGAIEPKRRFTTGPLPGGVMNAPSRLPAPLSGPVGGRAGMS